MNNKEFNHEKICEAALDSLKIVRNCMLEIALNGMLESSDFDKINALELQLMELRDKTAPKYEPLSLAYIFEG